MDDYDDNDLLMSYHPERRRLTPEQWEAFHKFKEEGKRAAQLRRWAEEEEAKERMAEASKALHARGVMLPLSRKHTKMSTISDWAHLMGIKMTPSAATKLGHRCARMYKAMYGKPPRMTVSLRRKLFARNWYGDTKRIKSKDLTKVAVYPRLLIERAWQMVMAEMIRDAEAWKVVRRRFNYPRRSSLAGVINNPRPSDIAEDSD
jgi:hypothetical protein